MEEEGKGAWEKVIVVTDRVIDWEIRKLRESRLGQWFLQHEWAQTLCEHPLVMDEKAQSAARWGARVYHWIAPIRYGIMATGIALGANTLDETSIKTPADPIEETSSEKPSAIRPKSFRKCTDERNNHE